MVDFSLAIGLAALVASIMGSVMGAVVHVALARRGNNRANGNVAAAIGEHISHCPNIAIVRSDIADLRTDIRALGEKIDRHIERG